MTQEQDQERLTIALGKLVGWLESWRTEEGAYLGFVVHRSETKRMRDIHDTAWTQAAMIRGYANLYRKSKEERWRERLELAADLQASRFEPETGKFRYAGHEDDRFCSLVHCALAGRALLDASDLLDEERKRRYLEVVRENVDRYWTPNLWVEEEGAYRFSEVDYYSPGEDRFVLNFNCVAAELLLGLSERTGDEGYRNTAHRIGEWLVQGHARAVEHSLGSPITRLASTPMDAPPGGLPYQYTPTQRTPDDCVAIYAGLSLGGIVALYESMGREELREMATETANFLMALRDPETGLFYHTTRGPRIEPYPQFVAGAGMTLAGLFLAEPLLGPEALAEDTLDALLNRAYPNGAFPNFIGKDANRPGGRSRKVWEDAVAGTNWNAQLFEYLTLRIEEPKSIQETPCRASAGETTSSYYYSDTSERTTIVSWNPPRSWGIYRYLKKRAKPAISLDPRTAGRSIRKLGRG